MVSTPSVLIVDASEETREVLKTALERRGVRTLLAGHIRPALKMVKEHSPDLVVLDLDDSGLPPEEACIPFSQGGQATTPRLMVLGSFRRPPQSEPRHEFVIKPYHFGPLIRRIEELLSTVGFRARCA